MIEAIVPGVLLAIVVALNVWFYRYSHTERWLKSETKAALWRTLVFIGPMFGGHPPPPPPEKPVISAPLDRGAGTGDTPPNPRSGELVEHP